MKKQKELRHAAITMLAHTGKSAQHHIGTGKQRSKPAGMRNMPGKKNGAGVFDTINHPKHYTQHPSGVECIEITEHMSFTLGNAVKYIWRADLKGDAIEDLRKAKWYIERELKRRGAK